MNIEQYKVDFFNKKLVKENRKVLWLIIAVFLPPYTTSVLQPCDAGIKKCFKGYYRLNFARRVCQAINDNEDTQVQLYQAIPMMIEAWKQVTPATITHCFRHCGFHEAKCQVEPQDDEFTRIEINSVQELERIQKSYNELNVKKEMVEFEELLEIDQNVEICPQLSEGIVPTSAQNQVEEEEEDDEEIVSVVTKSQVYIAFDLLKLYASQCSSDDKAFGSSLMNSLSRLFAQVETHKPNLVKKKN